MVFHQALKRLRDDKKTTISARKVRGNGKAGSSCQVRPLRLPIGVESFSHFDRSSDSDE
jgi:hypothetical protein